MRRVDRRRLERIRRRTLTIGLSFTIGALTAVGLTWRNDARDGGRSERIGRTSELTQSTIEPRTIDVPTAGPVIAEDAKPAATIGPAPDIVVASRDRDLAMPVDGVDRDDLRDTFSEARGGRVHEALDILAPRGTPVRAVRDGHIEKLFISKAGGLTIYQFERSNTYVYYYAHLDRYAPGLEEGQEVDKGDVIGYVGSTGNASPDAPHLHFAIFRLTPERQWWKGEPLNPYPLLKQ
jgi:murein DD-endopeptidase MepM/ murein hydrolase activator NlpD